MREDNLRMFQTHWRRSVENPSTELRRSKWAERATGLVEHFGTGVVISFPKTKSPRVRKRSPRQPRRTNVNPSKLLLPDVQITD
jgi:hypothetical protein